MIKNTLGKLSNGEFLLFFDSDDIMCPNMIETIIPLQQISDFVKPMLLNYNHGENPYIMDLKPTNKYGEGVFSINKKLFLSMNGFEGWRCAADSDFMGRLYKNERTFKYTPKIVFYRRIHPESLTQQSDTNMSSKLREYYVKLSKNRKDFGPLPKLATEKYYEILKDYIKPVEILEPKKNRIDFILQDVLKINVKGYKTNLKVNYDLVNYLTNNFDYKIPVKNDKPIEYKPKNRNDLFEIKKGTMASKENQYYPKKRTDNDNNNYNYKKNNSNY